MVKIAQNRGGHNNEPRPWEISQRMWELGYSNDEIAEVMEVGSKAFTTRRMKKNAKARREGKLLPYPPRPNGSKRRK